MADLHNELSKGLEPVPISVEGDISNSDDFEFLYVVRTVPGPDPMKEELCEQLKGCECSGVSSCYGYCECLSRFTKQYDKQLKIIATDAHKDHSLPIYECNRDCKCANTCSNRVVQRGLQTKVQVFKTKDKGYALRTLEDIEAKRFFCEYAGEILTVEMARKRSKSLADSDCKNYYIMSVHEHFGIEKRFSTYIDPMYIGNVARFVNHSCDPNLFMVPIRIDHTIPRLALFALRDIKKGEELTFSYSGNVDEEESPDLELGASFSENISSDSKIKRRPCYCESSNCKKFLPYDVSIFDF